MPYASTLSDEGIPEDRLAIQFPQGMDSGGSIGDPIFIVKRYRRINRQSHFPNEGQPEVHSSFILFRGYLQGVCHTPLP